jgi:hypothetical protein
MPKHNSGSLKQQNKKHKEVGKRAQQRGLGAGKVAQKKASGGGGSVNTLGTLGQVKGPGSKASRLNRATQQRKQKKDEITIQRRLGSASGPPKIVAMLALSDSADSKRLLAALLGEATASSKFNASSSTIYAHYSDLKGRFCFLDSPDHRELGPLLETGMLSDVIVLVVDVSAGFESMVDRVSSHSRAFEYRSKHSF